MTRPMPPAVVLFCVLSTAGCTVPVGGVTGVSVDAEGRPVAVVSMCEGFIDGLVLYLAAGEAEVDVAEWDSAVDEDGFAEVSLADPKDPWSATTALPALLTQPDGVTYELFGGTSDNSWSSAHVAFTAETLRGLEPGEILTQGYEFNTYADKDVVVDRETFKTKSCP